MDWSDVSTAQTARCSPTIQNRRTPQPLPSETQLASCMNPHFTSPVLQGGNGKRDGPVLGGDAIESSRLGAALLDPEGHGDDGVDHEEREEEDVDALRSI